MSSPHQARQEKARALSRTPSRASKCLQLNFGVNPIECGWSMLNDACINRPRLKRHITVFARRYSVVYISTPQEFCRSYDFPRKKLRVLPDKIDSLMHLPLSLELLNGWCFCDTAVWGCRHRGRHCFCFSHTCLMSSSVRGSKEIRRWKLIPPEKTRPRPNLENVFCQLVHHVPWNQHFAEQIRRSCTAVKERHFCCISMDNHQYRPQRDTQKVVSSSLYTVKFLWNRLAKGTTWSAPWKAILVLVPIWIPCIHLHTHHRFVRSHASSALSIGAKGHKFQTRQTASFQISLNLRFCILLIKYT